jgi:glyoxylase-like metal-dependent hydrolase (beta-lactamase superfamily II)
VTSPNPSVASASAPVWPEDLRPGRPVEVAPGVVRIIAPNPGMFTGPGTNTYLIGSGPLALVDPGPDDDVHLAAVCEAVGDRLRWILATHTHYDHSPLSVKLREATGASVIGFGPAPQGANLVSGVNGHDRAFSPDRLMGDGDRLDAGDFAIDAVYTPGHASNHLCFELAGTGLLFSGDHVMSGSTVVIPPPDGDMALYMDSLEKVRARPLTTIAPGHGDLIPDPAAVLDGYLRHRREREEQVLAGLAAAPPGGVTAEALVTEIYRDVPTALHPAARSSVWAHLRKLAAEGRASAADVDDIDAPWTRAQPSPRSRPDHRPDERPERTG